MTAPIIITINLNESTPQALSLVMERVNELVLTQTLSDITINQDNVSRFGEQLNFIEVTIRVIYNYACVQDGCPANKTTLEFMENRKLDLTIHWPESNIGSDVSLVCPCGNFSLINTTLRTARQCKGNFIEGGKWEELDVAACNFTLRARKMCSLSQVNNISYNKYS